MHSSSDRRGRRRYPRGQPLRSARKHSHSMPRTTSVLHVVAVVCCCLRALRRWYVADLDLTAPVQVAALTGVGPGDNLLSNSELGIDPVFVLLWANYAATS